MPNKELLLTYANNKIQIDKLIAENEMLKPAVLEEIYNIRGHSENPVELADLPGCSYTINKGRKQWTYSETTQETEKRLKNIKKEEEQTGVATFEEGDPVLVFNQPK